MSARSIRHPDFVCKAGGILVLASTLKVGGGELVLSRLLLELQEQGLGLTLLTLKEAGPVGDELARQCTVISMGLRSTRSPSVLWHLLKVLRSGNYRLVYIQDHHDCLFWGRLAAALAGFIPTVSPVHNSAQGDLRAFRLYNRLLLGLSPNLVTLGPWQEEALRRRECLPEGFWQTIPNPVDLAPVGEQVNLKTAARERLVIGAVAALRPEKRHDLMLELVAVLGRSRPLELWLIGDGEMREILTKQCDALGISDSVHFLGRRDDVADLLPRLDLFLLTSSEEALPLCILEAIAAAVPVAATPRGAIPDLLAQGRRGLLFSGEDPSAWARQLDIYLANLPSPEELAAWGREIVAAHTPAKFTSSYLELLGYLGGER
ncbi:MAG: glycosyltransferase [bacterium]|nr:glycosyltransferase [bacterium]